MNKKSGLTNKITKARGLTSRMRCPVIDTYMTMMVYLTVMIPTLKKPLKLHLLSATQDPRVVVRQAIPEMTMKNR
jgi:hypothetical protein